MTENKQDTKTRLLNAAEVLFAERGYDDVSIRDLAAEADVNVAAVNYHFQGKENLFSEVIKRRFVGQRDRTIDALTRVRTDSGDRPDLDKVINALVTIFFDSMLAGTNSSYLAILGKELHGPQQQFHTAFFQILIAPVFKAFSEGLMAARPHLEQDQLNWIIASIMSQIHHFHMRWMKRQCTNCCHETLDVMLDAFPALSLPKDQYIQEVTDHITRFSTAAIDGMYPEVS